MGDGTESDQAVVTPQTASDVDARHCEIARELLTLKYMVPILMELDHEPHTRKQLSRLVKAPSSGLDRTIQAMASWGVIERSYLPRGRSDGPSVAITEMGRTLLAAVTRLSEWQHAHHSDLLANKKDWEAKHGDA
jgi:DNA-binding HxlR family transcriptional regulator